MTLLSFTARMPVCGPCSRIVQNRPWSQNAVDLMLDTYSGAAAAYSVRKLRKGYSGACLRVRRSSDSTEMDIGFDGVNLNSTVLLDFVGAGDGCVTTIYDQTGNGNHLTQGTALAQPKCVSAGVLVTKNGKAAIDFTASHWMGSTIAGLSDATNLSNFAVISPASAAVADGSTMHVFSYAAGGADTPNKGATVGSVPTGLLSSEKFGIYFSNSSINAGRLGSTTYANTAGEQLLMASFCLSTGASAYKNSNAITLNLAAGITTSQNVSPANDGSALSTFRINSIDSVTGVCAEMVQESIVFLDSQTANRAAIEAAINSFYSVY